MYKYSFATLCTTLRVRGLLSLVAVFVVGCQGEVTALGRRVQHLARTVKPRLLAFRDQQRASSAPRSNLRPVAKDRGETRGPGSFSKKRCSWFSNLVCKTIDHNRNVTNKDSSTQPLLTEITEQLFLFQLYKRYEKMKHNQSLQFILTFHGNTHKAKFRGGVSLCLLLRLRLSLSCTFTLKAK